MKNGNLGTGLTSSIITLKNFVNQGMEGKARYLNIIHNPEGAVKHTRENQ